jgi:hypothetical protein
MASARTGEGVDEWCAWLAARHRELTPTGR